MPLCERFVFDSLFSKLRYFFHNFILPRTTAESVAGSKSRAAPAAALSSSLSIESQARHFGKKKKLSGGSLCEPPTPPSSFSSSSSSGCANSAEAIEMVAKQNGSSSGGGNRIDGATPTTFSAALMDRVVATSSSAAAAASSLPNAQSQVSDKFENGNNNLTGITGIPNQSKINGSASNRNDSNQSFDGNSIKADTSSNNAMYKNKEQDKNIEFIPKVGDDNFTDKSIKDILRLICQFVRDQGLDNTYEALVEETQIKIENHIAYRLRETVLIGDWVSSFKCLNELLDHQLIDRIVMQKIKTSIYEQFFFELVMSKKYLDAALCLNIMVTTAEPNRQFSIINLSVYLMCSHSEFIRRNNSKKFDVMHYRRLLLNSIQGQLGLDLMLPPDRLKNLILQSFEYQTNNCKFHQSHDTASIREDFILSDHYCSK
ncbi:MAG: WD repeat-containing protein 26 [Marteilia pararefringens]